MTLKKKLLIVFTFLQKRPEQYATFTADTVNKYNINFLKSNLIGSNRSDHPHCLSVLPVRNKVLKIIVLTIILFTAYGINAQEIEPRNYSCLPTGVNAVVAAYSISDGNVVSDASSPIQGLSLTSHSLSAGL